MVPREVSITMGVAVVVAGVAIVVFLSGGVVWVWLVLMFETVFMTGALAAAGGTATFLTTSGAFAGVAAAGLDGGVGRVWHAMHRHRKRALADAATDRTVPGVFTWGSFIGFFPAGNVSVPAGANQVRFRSGLGVGGQGNIVALVCRSLLWFHAR
jgi:hypothetical protein